LGIAAYLPKPIKRSDLRVAILLTLGVRSTDGRPQALVTRHSLREARRTGRILLVEDNAVNQLVARRLLEKRGHSVAVANNGREAIAILEAQRKTQAPPMPQTANDVITAVAVRGQTSRLSSVARQ
jgi:hypothetical protein